MMKLKIKKLKASEVPEELEDMLEDMEYEGTPSKHDLMVQNKPKSECEKIKALKCAIKSLIDAI